MRYMVKTGAPWRWMPNDFPPWPTCYQQTQRWIKAGVFEAIVHDLEEGQLGLAEALARYEQGVQHLKRCYLLLEGAERKSELLTSESVSGAGCSA